jgi:hypothetical protein
MSIAFAEGFFWRSGDQSLSFVGRPTNVSSPNIQDFTLSKVSCQHTARNPLSPAKRFVRASPSQDPFGAICVNPKSLPKGLKD